MMRNEIVALSNVHNPNITLNTFGHDPGLHMVRPAPVLPPVLHNITLPDKPSPPSAMRYLRLPLQTFSQARHVTKTLEINGPEPPPAAKGEKT